MKPNRTYLDWNASAPLRTEAREAMVAAFDVTGNPSSIHAEGRAARAAVERARAQVAKAAGAEAADVVFVSGATEAAALCCAGRGLTCAIVEHEAVLAWCETALDVNGQGAVVVQDPARSAVQVANSETGVVQTLPEGLAVVDATQALGKVPFAFDWSGAEMAFISAHKIGGPKGVGAVFIRRGLDVAAAIKGGGQEMGRRAGTENVAAIAGFGAAAEAAQADLDAGLWTAVAKRRDQLEDALRTAAPDLICVGQGATRLPNTALLVAPGWKGETQVMQMDLAGFAVSAGSACSSGKLRGSGTLTAMGFSPEDAGCALRVSLGPTTTDDDVGRFAEAWTRQWNKHRARAA